MAIDAGRGSRGFQRAGFGFDMPAFRRWCDPAHATRPVAGHTIPFPAVDITRDIAGYVLTAELPGLTENDVEITVKDDMLILRGEKKRETRWLEHHRTLSERCYGAFERHFWLPNGIDIANLDAQCADGVLTIRLPEFPAASSPDGDIKGEDAL